MATETENKEMALAMAKAGVLYGHKKTKTHPRMKPYIGGRRNEIELLDPETSLVSIEKAAEFLKQKMKEGGLVLFVGTRPAAKDAILALANSFNAPYVTFRWLGGILTNFKVLRQRSSYYQDLKARQEKGELSKYTKKEQLDFAKEIGKMSRMFDGLELLTRLPDALFVVDIEEHETAVREARRLHIPIVAILDTNDDPRQVEYPILANDHAKSSVEWVIEALKKGISEGV